MQSTERIPQEGLTRQERLIIWLRRNGIKNVDVARAVGVGAGTVRCWFEAESIPSWRHESLVKYGIPADLLPKPVNIAPGPRRAANEKARPADTERA